MIGGAADSPRHSENGPFGLSTGDNAHSLSPWATNEHLEQLWVCIISSCGCMSQREG